MEILVKLRFDENNLGQQWMNVDNLNLLLYSEASTKKELLKVVSFVETSDMNTFCTICGRSTKGKLIPFYCSIGCENKACMAGL